MNTNLDQARWSENVIIADADYVDAVAFDIIVNFERIIGRRIPKADMARWVDCIALDGGLRPGEHTTQVVLLHGESRSRLENFEPGEIDGDEEAYRRLWKIFFQTVEIRERRDPRAQRAHMPSRYSNFL